MKLRVLTNFIFCLVTLSLFLSCSDKHDDESSTPKTARRTVIVYMAAQNDLGIGYPVQSQSDSTEIAFGTQFLPTTNDNIVLFIDDSKKPRIYRFYRASNGKSYNKKIIQYDTDLNSASGKTLTQVLTDVKKACPSESYALVLWSHGSAWLPNMKSTKATPSTNSIKPNAFGIDVGEGGNMYTNKDADGYLGNQMEISDLADAIVKSEVHLDYIMFDACLMQTIEVAYELRNAADYIIGSPCSTSSYGCVYNDQIKDGFFAYPTTDETIKKIVDTYYYDVMDNPVTKSYYTSMGCVMSVIRTSELENLANVTSQVLTKAIFGKTSIDLSSIHGYTQPTSGYPDCYDMATVLHKTLPDTDFQNWKTVADRCIIYKKVSEKYLYSSSNYFVSEKNTYDDCCGVSMFVPQTRYNNLYTSIDLNDAFRSTAWYKDAGWELTGW